MNSTNRVEQIRLVMSSGIPGSKIDFTLQLPSTMSRFVPIPQRSECLRCSSVAVAQLADPLSVAAGCLGGVRTGGPALDVGLGGCEIVRTGVFDGESRSATARVATVATRPLQVIIDRRGDLLLRVAALTERP